MPGQPGIPGWFIAIFVIMIIVAIGTAIARASYRSSRGLNPFFPQDQVDATIVNSQIMRPAAPEQPAKTIEERLAELDDLHGRGVISDDEWHEGRSKAISEG
jgi:hypothetical protein